jgi:uncharacterized protein YuzE
MRITYDAEVDAISITFSDTTVTTRDLGDGITAEFDADGKIVGIEILDAARRLGGEDPLRQVILEGVGLKASA